MKELNKVIEQAQALIEEKNKYDHKVQKSTSKRMRDAINAIKKSAVAAKRELIAADKGGK